MALITNATTNWSVAVTLVSDEIWQSRKGSVFVSSEASPAAEGGIALQENTAVRFSAGVSVRYRKEGVTEALIVREAV